MPSADAPRFPRFRVIVHFAFWRSCVVRLHVTETMKSKRYGELKSDVSNLEPFQYVAWYGVNQTKLESDLFSFADTFLWSSGINHCPLAFLLARPNRAQKDTANLLLAANNNDEERSDGTGRPRVAIVGGGTSGFVVGYVLSQSGNYNSQPRGNHSIGSRSS